MSRRSDEKLAEAGQWWHEHQAESASEIKRIERLETMVNVLLYTLTYIAEDLQALERREPGEGLWLPNSYRMDQGLREGGDQRA